MGRGGTPAAASREGPLRAPPTPSTGPGLAAVQVGEGADCFAGPAFAPNGDDVMVGGGYETRDVGCIVALSPSGRLDPASRGAGLVEVSAPTAGLDSRRFNPDAVQGSRLVTGGAVKSLDADHQPVPAARRRHELRLTLKQA